MPFFLSMVHGSTNTSHAATATGTALQPAGSEPPYAAVELVTERERNRRGGPYAG